MIKSFIIIFLFCTSANAQVVIDWYKHTPSSLDYPNKINPNPELITNDAAALDPTENVNAINLTNQAAFGDRTSETTNNGWTTYSRRITATSENTLRRDRLRITNLLTIGQIYSLDVVHKNGDTTGTGRNRVSTGGTGVDNNHTAHTAWTLHSYEFVANSTTFEYNEFVRGGISLVGQWSEYNISLKQKVN